MLQDRSTVHYHSSQLECALKQVTTRLCVRNQHAFCYRIFKWSPGAASLLKAGFLSLECQGKRRACAVRKSCVNVILQLLWDKFSICLWWSRHAQIWACYLIHCLIPRTGDSTPTPIIYANLMLHTTTFSWSSLTSGSWGNLDPAKMHSKRLLELWGFS